MTREEIRNNRIKFVKGLQEPHRKKHVGKLENPDEPTQRCCLGHGCNIFNIKRSQTKYDDGRKGVVSYGIKENHNYAPQELMDLLGLYDNDGIILIDNKMLSYNKYSFKSLSLINDDSTITPQEIGKLLETMIDGGDGTPFKPLSEY